MQTPSFIYGTAWKEETTAELVQKAVACGFRAIDTANQPKHYQEPLVGEALLALAGQGIGRGDLFLQTKFTPADGHDQRIPYDPSADLTAQVGQSFESSLKHLHTDTLDAYLLHGPYSYPGLGEEDWEVWGAMEDIARSGRARQIGISNVNQMQLKELWEKAKVKPAIVQNRCFANQGWDKAVRDFCRTHDILYQGFSLLTANTFVLHHPEVQKIAARLNRTPMQIIFRFALQAGMVPLTGTTDPQHMKEDLQIFDFELTAEEVEMMEKMGG